MDAGICHGSSVPITSGVGVAAATAVKVANRGGFDNAGLQATSHKQPDSSHQREK